MLILTTPGRKSDYVLLTGPDGEPINQQVLPFVALPVLLEGELYRYGDVFELRTDPASIEVIH